MSRDNEVDLLARKGEGVTMSTVMREALSPARNAGQRKRAEKLGKVLRRHVVPAVEQPGSVDISTVEAEARLARREADVARSVADAATARQAADEAAARLAEAEGR